MIKVSLCLRLSGRPGWHPKQSAVGQHPGVGNEELDQTHGGALSAG